MELKGDARMRFENGDSSKGSAVLKRSKLDMHPDFAALGAFVLHVPDGTRFTLTTPAASQWCGATARRCRESTAPQLAP